MQDPLWSTAYLHRRIPVAVPERSRLTAAPTDCGSVPSLQDCSTEGRNETKAARHPGARRTSASPKALQKCLKTSSSLVRRTRPGSAWRATAAYCIAPGIRQWWPAVLVLSRGSHATGAAGRFCIAAAAVVSRACVRQLLLAECSHEIRADHVTPSGAEQPRSVRDRVLDLVRVKPWRVLPRDSDSGGELPDR